MNLIGDTRDVTPEIFATFADTKSEQRREDAYKTYERLMDGRPEFGVVDKALAPASVSKEAWMKAHPPGFIEYYEALAPRGKYGEWLRKHDPLARVGDSLFMHAGINPDTAPPKAEDVNVKVRDEVKRFDDIRKTLVDAKIAAPWFTLGELLDVSRHYLKLTQRPGGTELAQAQPHVYKAMFDLDGIGAWSVVNGNGPMWFRGFAQWPDADGAPLVAKLLQQYGAARFVTGHTPQATGRIMPRFENRVFLIDTGMLAAVYKGRPSALEIKDGVITAIYTDRRDVLVKQVNCCATRLRLMIPRSPCRFPRSRPRACAARSGPMRPGGCGTSATGDRRRA